MNDIAVVEANGNGGDLVLKGSDLALQAGWGNMPYLAMFGGNIEGVTKNRIIGEEAKDWWGNNLLMPQDSIQFNCLTERTLNEVALTSSGRVRIEQAVKSDLAFMSAFAEVAVSVTYAGIDKVKILIRVSQPDTISNRIPDQYRQYIFIWDATKQQLADYSVADYNEDYNLYD